MLFIVRGRRRPRKGLPRHNGAIVWKGRSVADGRPLTAVATCLRRRSRNPKTGPMAQVYLVRSDVKPDRAVQTGADASVCNGCELRPLLVNRLGVPNGTKPAMCYVVTHFALNQVWRAAAAGHYPRAGRPDWAGLFEGKRVRFGAYGNWSNVPRRHGESLLRAAPAWTLYEHNWRAPHARWLAEYAMASVSSVAAKEEANRAGWRTFRVKRPGEPVLKDEMVCPASKEAGHKTDCYHCLVCAGWSGRGARHVVIDDHGPTSAAQLARAAAGRVQLGLARLLRTRGPALDAGERTGP